MQYNTLFTDIGGVLLTNGWDRHSRTLACERFQLNQEELEKRHQAVFGLYEIGAISLDAYLSKIIFYQPRAFTPDEFKKFIFDQSRAFPEMIALLSDLKKQHRLKVVAVNNEGLELNNYRIQTFQLNQWIDFFVSTCFVHMQKPDPAIFRLA